MMNGRPETGVDAERPGPFEGVNSLHYGVERPDADTVRARLLELGYDPSHAGDDVIEAAADIFQGVDGHVQAMNDHFTAAEELTVGLDGLGFPLLDQPPSR